MFELMGKKIITISNKISLSGSMGLLVLCYMFVSVLSLVKFCACIKFLTDTNDKTYLSVLFRICPYLIRFVWYVFAMSPVIVHSISADVQ